MAEKRDIEQSDVQAIIDVFAEDKNFAPRCRKVGVLLKDRLYDISSYYWDYWISMGKFPEITASSIRVEKSPLPIRLLHDLCQPRRLHPETGHVPS
jgi:hypothetical protein